jgi:excisionase family DNA binding protein
MHRDKRPPDLQPARTTEKEHEMGEQDLSVEDQLLSPRQVADLLGVPVATIYQWRYRSEGPPGFKLGGHVRYRRSTVDAWLDEHADPWS